MAEALEKELATLRNILNKNIINESEFETLRKTAMENYTIKPAQAASEATAGFGGLAARGRGSA